MKIIRMRFRQLWREWLKLNMLYRLVILVVPLLLIYAIAWQAGTDTVSSYVIVALAGAVIFSVHHSRKDRHFFNVHFLKEKKIFFQEYLAFSLPVFICLIITTRWLAALILLLVILAVVNLKIPATRGQKVRYKFLRRLLPHFEWVAGIRASGLVFIVLILLSIVLAYFPFVSIALMFLVCTIISGFYNEYEPLDLLVIFSKSGGKFIRLKLYGALKLFFLTMAIPATLYIIFHPYEWYIIAAFILLCMISLMATIILKYKAYYPHGEVHTAGVLQAMVMISSLFPLILPVPLFVILYYYPAAVRNINTYLLDNNK